MTIQENKIYNVDCFRAIKTMGDKSVDICFTSPPYNRIRNDTYRHFEDIQQDYFKFLCEITDEMLRVAKKQVIINIQLNHFNKVDVCRFIGNYAEKIKGIIIWEKSNPQPASNFKNNEYSVTNAYEYFFVMGNDSSEFRANHKIKNILTTSINSDHFEGHGAVMKKRFVISLSRILQTKVMWF